MRGTIFAGLLSVACALPALAAVSEEDAARLGRDLTPTGAERAGNADGSIPEWTGTIRGLPPGLHWDGPGHPHPDPFSGETPTFSITADNASEHEARLGAGQLALLRTYPRTYRIDVYPTHRDFRMSEDWEARTRHNATHAETYNEGDGIRGFAGGTAFPVPRHGSEPIWNSRLNSAAVSQEGLADDVAVFANGSRSVRTSHFIMDVLYADRSNPHDIDFGAANRYAAHIWNETLMPVRDKGTITLILEPLDYSSTPRAVWRYLPGSRRIRQAPNIGYDTPDGPGGILTIDDTLGFNGALDRFTWKIVGRQEMYVPFHAYRFDDPSRGFDDILGVGHVNPGTMRYELRRVWIVEANLRPGFRHVYARRRFYIEEDSWNIVATENYDGHDELWKTVLINTLYAYDVQGYEKRSQMFHDLRAGVYIVTRMTNRQRAWNFSATPRGDEFFTIANLRKAGKR